VLLVVAGASNWLAADLCHRPQPATAADGRAHRPLPRGWHWFWAILEPNGWE